MTKHSHDCTFAACPRCLEIVAAKDAEIERLRELSIMVKSHFFTNDPTEIGRRIQEMAAKLRRVEAVFKRLDESSRLLDSAYIMEQFRTALAQPKGEDSTDA